MSDAETRVLAAIRGAHSGLTSSEVRRACGITEAVDAALRLLSSRGLIESRRCGPVRRWLPCVPREVEA